MAPDAGPSGTPVDVPLPSLPPAAPQFGNALTRAVGRWALKLSGWRVDGDLPDVRRCVAIMAPHTSNFDLPLAIALMMGMDVRVSVLAKHTVFRWPLSVLMRAIGAVSVDRGAATDVVAQAASVLRAADKMFLGLAPEGTRARVPRWKTGFYRIAVAAGVPIVTVGFDYARRVVTIWPPFWPTGCLDDDLAVLQARFSAAMGRHPERYGQ